MQHFPRWVAKAAGLSNVYNMILINEETNFRLKCKVKRSKRKPVAYSIGLGWYQLAKDLNLNLDDQLLFGLEHPPLNLHVRVIRNALQNSVQ